MGSRHWAEDDGFWLYLGLPAQFMGSIGVNFLLNGCLIDFAPLKVCFDLPTANPFWVESLVSQRPSCYLFGFMLPGPDCY